MAKASQLKVFESKKSASTFVVSGDERRAYIQATGQAATNPKVKAEIDRVRKGGCDMATAEWTARMLANTY